MRAIRQGLFAGLIVLTMTALPALAQFPSKPVRLVLPFPAGSSVDAISRILSPPLSQSLGQPVVVENKPGADGAIAAIEVMRASPDGHTLLFATNSPLNSVPAMRKTPPYDPIADFTPIGSVTKYLHFVLVHPGVPASSVADFFKYARANPGRLNYGSGGTFHQISAAELMKVGGFNATHVYYKGEAAALLDLVAGRLQFMVCSQGTSQQFVRDGRLRAIASTSSKRTAADPGVPTMAEAGLPPFSVYPWSGVFGPAKVPGAVVEQLNRVLNTVLARPDVREKLERQAMEIIASTPAELDVLNKQQLEVARKVVRELGLQQTD